MGCARTEDRGLLAAVEQVLAEEEKLAATLELRSRRQAGYREPRSSRFS